MPIPAGELAREQGGFEGVARGAVDVLAVLNDATRLVVSGAGGGQQGGATTLVEQVCLAGGGVAGADDLLGGGGNDVLGAQEVVEPPASSSSRVGAMEAGMRLDRTAIGSPSAQRIRVQEMTAVPSSTSRCSASSASPPCTYTGRCS